MADIAAHKMVWIFINDAKYYSMPEYTQKEIINLDPHEGDKLYEWLNQCPKITELSISKFVERPLDVVTKSTYNQLSITTDTNVKCNKS